MGDQSTAVIAIAVLFFVLTWLVVGLRIYTRIVVNKSFGADDVTITAMLVVFTVYLVAQIKGWLHGLGKHESELTSEDRSAALMWWFICYLLYIVCVCLFKVSVGLFLMRVAIKPLHIWVLRLFTWGTVVIGTTYFFLVLFQCNPPSTFWEVSPRAPDKCWSDPKVLGLDITAAIINCTADWVFGILPIFIVRRLNMPTRTKYLVMALLGFAAVGSIATFVRMFFLPNLLDGDDFLYASTPVAYLSTVECGVGITAVSLGTLKPLYDQILQKRGTDASHSTHSSWPSRRHRSSLKHRSYIRADSADVPPGPYLRPERGPRTDYSMGTSVVVSFDHDRRDEAVRPPLDNSTEWNGITRTIEVTQSRRNIRSVRYSILETLPQVTANFVDKWTGWSSNGQSATHLSPNDPSLPHAMTRLKPNRAMFSQERSPMRHQVVDFEVSPIIEQDGSGSQDGLSDGDIQRLDPLPRGHPRAERNESRDNSVSID
ncbi:hypothetical protein BX600DRAFT_544266 [Xylariales sp. PMI_506]|nr:hypothetical protein BX600DRAFT_544266 [Xylariales sp. PMI_506]